MKELARKIISSRHGITGVQPKISLGLERTMDQRKRLTLMTGDFILKPPAESYPQMPENEDLTMHLAETVGIKTTPHALIPLLSGELAYITRRIDRTSKGKVHMEDLCQLSGLLTEDKYRSSMERVGKVIRQYSTYPILDLINVFELTLFCFVTGNNDMHLKNFSLIDRGVISLAPVYDLLNIRIPLPSDSEESALPVNGRKNKLKRSDFVLLSRNYGLDETQFEGALKNLFAKTDELLSWIGNSFLSEENKTLYCDIVNERMERLRDEG
jgi:serine/threonine-protein kinase HipA